MALSKIQNNSYADTAVHGRRNLIINGAMQVAQRGTSSTGLQNSGGIFTADRFSYRRSGTWANAQFSHTIVDASGTGDAGLNKALKVTCTTAEGGAVPSGAGVAVGYYMEKGDTHRLGVGTANALQSVLSFYAKASIATTYGIEIKGKQHSTVPNIRIPFTISSANTWERISVSIPADTSALNSDADNTDGWYLHIVLDGGAATNTASVWTTDENNVLLPNGVSTTAFSNTLNATFEVTGVQLEVGSQATPFEHRSFGEELALCERYYQIASPLAGNANGTNAKTSVSFKTAMRTQPTLSFTSNSFDITDGYASNYASTNANPSWQYYVDSGGGVITTANHSSVSGDFRQNTMLMNSAQKLFMDAEL